MGTQGWWYGDHPDLGARGKMNQAWRLRNPLMSLLRAIWAMLRLVTAAWISGMAAATQAPTDRNIAHQRGHIPALRNEAPVKADF